MTRSAAIPQIPGLASFAVGGLRALGIGVVWLGMRMLLLGRRWEDAAMEEKGLVELQRAQAVLRQQGRSPGSEMK